MFLAYGKPREESGLSIRGAGAPSEKVCRNTLALFLNEVADACRVINREFLARQAKMDGSFNFFKRFELFLPKESILKRAR